jgi:hypothetical protein
MDKIKIKRTVMAKILQHYENVLYQKFFAAPITPAVMETMQQYINSYQKNICMRETMPGWNVALKLVAEPYRNIVNVTVDPQANIEYID